LASLGHPCKFQRVSCLASVTARHSSSGRQPDFATLNRGRHLRSAGRPSRWALAHILVLSCFFFFSFFPRLISAVQIACLPYFYTWCGPSANLECMSEMCCTRLAGNAGPKKSPKIGHLGTIAQLCGAISSQLRHISTIKKTLLNSDVSPTCSHNTPHFSALAAEICSRV